MRAHSYFPGIRRCSRQAEDLESVRFPEQSGLDVAPLGFHFAESAAHPAILADRSFLARSAGRGNWDNCC